jgi:hypothetical protein
MSNPVAAMTAYVQLARLSHQKRQALARDRFLLLAAVAACEAGWLDVAARCQSRLRSFAPAHRLHHYASVPVALRDVDFRTLVRATERHCPFERAEHLLVGLGLTAEGDQPDIPRGDWALQVLNDRCWDVDG